MPNYNSSLKFTSSALNPLILKAVDGNNALLCIFALLTSFSDLDNNIYFRECIIGEIHINS